MYLYLDNYCMRFVNIVPLHMFTLLHSFWPSCTVAFRSLCTASTLIIRGPFRTCGACFLTLYRGFLECLTKFINTIWLIIATLASFRLALPLASEKLSFSKLVCYWPTASLQNFSWLFIIKAKHADKFNGNQ